MEKLFVHMYRHITCRFLLYIEENWVDNHNDNDIRKIKGELIYLFARKENKIERIREKY